MTEYDPDATDPKFGDVEFINHRAGSGFEPDSEEPDATILPCLSCGTLMLNDDSKECADCREN